MNDEAIKEFLVESYENLDQLDRDFVALEQTPDDRARLGSVFRTIHTIKGTCGFFGFGKLESLTHVGENLLSRLREGELLLVRQVLARQHQYGMLVHAGLEGGNLGRRQRPRRIYAGHLGADAGMEGARLCRQQDLPWMGTL